MKPPDVEHTVAVMIRGWADEYLTSWTSRRVSASGSGEIEARVKDNGALAETLILALQFNHPVGQVYVTNILMPERLKRRGLGKRLIAAIFRIASDAGYRLFITGMVPGFYNRLVRRGASVVVEDDAVLITEKTDLSHHYD